MDKQLLVWTCVLLHCVCMHMCSGALTSCSASDRVNVTQFDLCQDGECTELETVGNFQSGAPDSGQSTPTCTVAEPPNNNNAACSDSRTAAIQHCTDCNSTHSQNLWPEISYSLEYVPDQDNPILVDVNWTEPGIRVSGYQLVITPSEVSHCTRVEDPDVTILCVADLSNDTMHFRYQLMRPFPGSDTTITELHIKLIPNGWCNSPETSFRIPRTCHSLCPGECELCGTDGPDLLRRARQDKPDHVDVSLCKDANAGTLVANISWVPTAREEYYYPDVNETLFFTILRHDQENVVVSRYLRVVGRTQVTLHNLTLAFGRYSIKARRLYCGECPSWIDQQFIIDKDPEECPNTFTTTSTHSTTSQTPSGSSSTLPATTASSSDAGNTATEGLTDNAAGNTATDGLRTKDVHPALSSTLGALFAITILTFAVIASFVVVYKSFCRPPEPDKDPDLPFKHEFSDEPILPPKRPTDLNLTAKTLLIYSQSSPDEEKECILENVAKGLCGYYGIEVRWYDKCNGSVMHWLESNISESQKVLLVCNEAFKEEWLKPNEDAMFDGAIVHASKQFIQGKISTTESYSSKYGLVFLHERDVSLIPADYLKNLPKFLVDPGNPEKGEEIARFVLEEQYILPPSLSQPPMDVEMQYDRLDGATTPSDQSDVTEIILEHSRDSIV